jgi:hypothetical protein
MEDQTTMIGKPDAQSRIFNTSVRGWIALCLAVALCLTVFLIVVAPYFSVTIPDRVSDQLIALFSAGFGAAVTQYFNQKSKEGQSP